MFGEKKTEYKLITATTTSLGVAVTAALGDGWTLHGSPSTVVVGDDVIASQAVVKTLTTDGIDT